MPAGPRERDGRPGGPARRGLPWAAALLAALLVLSPWPARADPAQTRPGPAEAAAQALAEALDGELRRIEAVLATAAATLDPAPAPRSGANGTLPLGPLDRATRAAAAALGLPVTALDARLAPLVESDAPPGRPLPASPLAELAADAMESQQTAFGPDPGAEGGLALAVPILRGAGGRAVGALVARLPPERLRALPEAAGARAAWLAEGEPAPTPLLWLRRDGEAEASGPGFATAQRRLARDPRLILVAVAELPAPEMSAPAALPPEAQAVPDPSPRGAPETAVSPLLPGLIGLLVGGLLAALLLRRPPREAARLARQDAEEARRALAELRAICETIPVGLALLDAGAARLLSSNARLAAFAGLPPDALAGRPAADVLPPALAEVLLDAHARVLREGRPVLDLQVAAEAGGALRNIRQLLLSCHPVRAGDGRIEAVSAVVQDVTERARAEASRDLLVKELNHRVKNCLATVLTIAHQTLRGAGDDLGTFERSFSARIRALARAHDLLTLNAWHEADLGAVARAALAPWLEDPRLRIEPGPEVLLRPAQAQALVLAFNELATNAAKYGALTRPEGDVWLRWSLDPEGMVLLRWSESGGPPVPPRPARRGFGTRLLEQALSRDLGSGAEPTLLFDPEGLHANIRFRPRLCENVAFGAGWRQEGRPGDRRKGQRLPSGSGG